MENKCKRCHGSMVFIGVVPRLGRRVIGKQYGKWKCPVCNEVEYKKG